MKHKESRAALEQFVALNVQLLDLKRFQEANEVAARKILMVRRRCALVCCNLPSCALRSTISARR
jgi:hypothetical protein